ncbi:MAG: small conductance mechanosensitive channel [Bacteroidia bacterium]|jgi:small conductance mechanosensitive channel
MATLFAHYLPLLIVLIVCGAGLTLAHLLLLSGHKRLGSEARLPRQIALLLLMILSLVLAIIAAPLADSTRGQVLTLMGIALSAAIALSSTSFVTNFMAAVMLRVTKPFKVGDFIKVGDLFGKVSERGLFDTEIQTENRELIAIPNATFINQSVTVARSSGVIVSTTLSLGYDMSFAEVEPLMLEAAASSGLSGPYVHIVGLGDFSISYRVCGLLTDLESILTARSELNRHLLLKIHGAGLEIVSPTVTRHINQSAEHKIIPAHKYVAPRENTVLAEEIVFDRANEITKLAAVRKELQNTIQQLKESKDSDIDLAPILEELAHAEEALQELKKQKD